ncbi:MAG: hypothetical protein Q8865_07590 [Bacillota bacterium]|nr:hypothetical protein [Bacillota bacterium]
MNAKLIKDNIICISDYPSNSGFSYNFETGIYTIHVNKHDDFEKCIERGLKDIIERETAIKEIEKVRNIL